MQELREKVKKEKDHSQRLTIVANGHTGVCSSNVSLEIKIVNWYRRTSTRTS